ncbi:MAG: peptidylprolyl isomerase [Gammaproteobacteria bacterium]
MSALQNIRSGLSSTGSSIIVAILIFGLVATFGGFLTDPSAPSSSPLKINSKDISFGEFNLEFSRLSSMFSDSDVSEEIINEITRNSIISKELLFQRATELNMDLSEEFLNNLIANDSSFVINGEFDTALFSGYMARLGFTINDYRDLVKSKYLANNLSDFISRSEFSLETDALKFIRATNQQRSLSFIKLDLEKMSKEEAIPETDILNFYQQNQFRFIEPKKASLNYIVLTDELFKKDIQVSEEEVLDEMTSLENGTENSQTRVSHIQLSFTNEEEKNEQFLIASSILEKTKDFAFEKLAEEFSDDFGSSTNGGDLGYTDGSILPEEFESEIINLQVNEVSEVIEMSNSLHILKITEKSEQIFSKEDIKNQIILSKSSERLNQSLIEIEDNYFGESLDKLSSDFSFSIKSTELISENNLPNNLKSFNVSNEIFSQTDTDNQFFGPYENENGSFLLFELKEIQEESLLSQAEATQEIKEILQLEKARKSILEKSATYEIKAQNNDLSEFNSYSLIKRDSSLLPDNLLTDLFSIDLVKPIFVSTQDNGDIYVVKLTKVKNSTNLAKRDEINSAKESLKTLNSRVYLDTIFKELEEKAYIN